MQQETRLFTDAVCRTCNADVNDAELALLMPAVESLFTPVAQALNDSTDGDASQFDAEPRQFPADKL